MTCIVSKNDEQKCEVGNVSQMKMFHLLAR
jgi:hypothetical protein